MNQQKDTNFWISYADLMAGLLFVFILLIGAIIIKYSILDSESKTLEKSLIKEKEALDKSIEELAIKQAEIDDTNLALKKSNDALTKARAEIKNLEDTLAQLAKENQLLVLTLEQKDELIQQQQETNLLKDQEIQKYVVLKSELEAKLLASIVTKESLEDRLDKVNTSISDKSEEISRLLDEIVSKESLLESLKKSIEKLREKLKDFESRNQYQAIEISTLKNDYSVQRRILFEHKDLLKLKEKEIRKLLLKIKTDEVHHQKLVNDLQQTRGKIKSLTGIKIKVISLLKRSLGDDMFIDPKSGAIRLSSNVLFDRGKYTLKEKAKKSLKIVLNDYFEAILDNEEINKHIDKIIIEGHTDSKGSYLYNLNLSQKRAYSVMDFILTLDFNKMDKLRELIVASGRSFLDPINDENGKENMDASRRIEIKFSLKNENAIREIGRILEDD